MSVCFHRLAAPGQLVLFAMGGTAYLALEIAWRGTTHWTMFLAGGACLCALDALGRRQNAASRQQGRHTAQIS